MDFELLVRPLTSSQGACGEDMMFSAQFDEIQEARRFDDPSLSQGEWVTDVKEADWARVVRVCDDLLATRSKDIRVAVWLTEAMARVSGLAGLADGYTLLGRLCDSFWADIHPLPEDGDMEMRIGNLDWLVNQTARLIREVPLTRAAKGSYSSLDLDSARATAKNIEKNPGQADELARAARVTLEAFEAARKETPGAHFLAGMQDAERLKEAMTTLQRILDHHLGVNSPAFTNSLDVLDDLFRSFRRYAGEAGVLKEEAGAPASEGGSDVDVAEPLATAQSSWGPVQSREQAIRQLQEIAAYFKQTEPHSPVAYLAEKAAKWGSMSLHQWLRAVVKDDAALSRVEEMLGVETPPHFGDGQH